MHNAVIAGLICLLSTVALAADEWVKVPGPSYRGKTLELDAIVRKPDGEGPFATVVILHGCKGMSEDAEGKWAERLNSMGYAALMLESFRPRGYLESCNLNVMPGDRARDAHFAHRWLKEQSWVKSGQVALLGISHGGAGALAAVNGGNFPNETPFAAVIAIYPWCGHAINVLASPTLIMMGDADELTPKHRCESMKVRHLEGNAYTLKFFPGATHYFDVPAIKEMVLTLPNNDSSPDAPPLRDFQFRHDEEATRAAISEAREFLGTYLQQGSR